jgi:hypothetical protein
MNPTDYAEARELPLTSDSLIERRVAALVGRAQRRQIWLMFLDARSVQLPLLLPVADIPVAPGGPDHDGAERWAAVISGTCQAAGAESVLVVLERYGSEKLTEADSGWAREISLGCDLAGVALRAVVLSHRRGVTLVAPEEYEGATG